MRSKVQTILSNTETTIFARMSEATPQRVGTVRKQIQSATVDRHALETKDGAALSNDFENVKKLDTEAVARFFIAIGVAPEYYINSPAYDAETFAAKSKIAAEAKTRNLKAYKKFRETASYFFENGKLESVMLTFIACSILSAQHHTVIPRDVCERFLSSVPLSHVSEELSEALDHYRAKHMSGGASTQTSQCTLQLATMRAATVVRNGKNKDFQLDVHSPVVESFAQRFGMTAQLDKARSFRSVVDSEALESTDTN